MKNNTMGVLFASDPDSHLNDLTIHRTTASLPFGGRYRLIDFTLSNLVHANITTIGIVTRNNYNSLMDHLRMGRDWDLNRKKQRSYAFPAFCFQQRTQSVQGQNRSIVQPPRLSYEQQRGIRRHLEHEYRV